MTTIQIPLEKGKHRTYTVKLHGGIQLQIDMTKSACGFDLITKACEYLEYSHPYYFGLEYSYRKTKFTGWVNVTKPLKDEIDKTHRLVYLSFKYYDPEPENITCEALRHALYIQLRRDIVNGDLLNDVTILAKLSALCLQIEFGDFEDEIEFRRNASVYTFGPDYLNLCLEMGSEFYNKVLELYREYQGYEVVQAEIEFVTICSKLPFYGLHRFLFSDQHRNFCELGVGFYGLYIINSGNVVLSIVLWSIVQSIVLNDIDIIIKIEDKNPQNDSTLKDSDLNKPQQLDIYSLYPTRMITLRGHHHHYTRNFYRLVVESFNFYSRRKFSDNKTSSNDSMVRTLTEIQAEYHNTQSGVSISRSKYNKRSTSKNIKCPKTDLKKTSKPDSMTVNDTVRRRYTILKSDMTDTDDKMSTSTKLKDMLSRPKNNSKKKTLQKLKNNRNEIEPKRRRSATVTNSDGLLRADNQFNGGVSSSKNSNRNSFFGHDLPSNFTDNFTSNLPPSPASNNNFTLKAMSQLQLNSSNMSMNKIIEKTNESSESSISHLVIESINNPSRDGELKSHLSVFVDSTLAYDNSEGSHNDHKSTYVFDDRNPSESLENLDVLPKSDPLKNIITNTTDDILEFINNEQTLENGVLLAKLATNIKNNGPSISYTFNNDSHDNEISENWIQSIGNKSLIPSDTNTNCMDPLVNDFDKKLQIHDTEKSCNTQSNPILQATTTTIRNIDPSK